MRTPQPIGVLSFDFDDECNCFDCIEAPDRKSAYSIRKKIKVRSAT